jgi:hypothetical protein
LKRYPLGLIGEQYGMLKELFPQGRFAPPATAASIAAVETTLGVRFPEQLRALYLETDGFREGRGNAPYLFPLTTTDPTGWVTSLLSWTRFNWDEVKKYYPQLDLTPFIFYGSSRGDESWGINWKQPNEIIAFSFHWEEGQYEVVGSSIVDVYQADYSRYEA